MILCTGGVFAATKLFDLEDKFLAFFNIESEYASKIGIKANEVRKSAEFSNGIVTLTQMVADSHNIYIVFQLEGFYAEDVENIEIYKGKRNVNNVVSGNLAMYTGGEKSQSLIVNVSGIDELDDVEYINIEIQIKEEKSYIELEVEKTVKEFCKRVNYDIERQNGENLKLKNIKITPIGIELLSDITGNTEDISGGVKWGYNDFDKELILNSGEKIILHFGEYDIEHNVRDSYEEVLTEKREYRWKKIFISIHCF
ncbi:MAG: hypothetical protein J6J60_05175 [Clostridia bacterium]|nr:hypothetical protein [Clostridia bacterium]